MDLTAAHTSRPATQMDAIDFAAVIFASGAVIDVWHKGSLFAELRARLQAIHDVTPNNSLKGRLLELAACPFCKRYHVPIYLIAGSLFARYLGSPFEEFAAVLIFGLAATRIGNIIDGLLPNRMRYFVDPFTEENT